MVSFGVDPTLSSNVDKGVAIYSQPYCLVTGENADTTNV